jgi:hypothetical protein
MDCHWYAFSFTGDNLTVYLQRSARLRRLLLRFLQLWQPVLVGEWSSVLPQRFFDATPREQHYALLGRNVAMQQQAYRHAATSDELRVKAIIAAEVEAALAELSTQFRDHLVAPAEQASAAPTDGAAH